MLGRFAAGKIRSIWEIWSDKKNAAHFDPIVLSGEKERQIFAQIDQSDMTWEKERKHCCHLSLQEAEWRDPATEAKSRADLQASREESDVVLHLPAVDQQIQHVCRARSNHQPWFSLSAWRQAELIGHPE